MAEISDVQVTFALYGQTLRPAHVSATLGLVPEHAHAVGDPHPIRTQAGLRWRNGAWLLESRQSASAPLDAHLRDVLDRLDPQAVQLLLGEGLTASFRVACWVKASQEGTTIAPETLQRIARLGGDLGLTIYLDMDDTPAG